MGTSKQTCCELCRLNHDIHYNNIKVNKRCKYCGEIVGFLYKKLTSRTKPDSYKFVCDKCKTLHMLQISDLMKLSNPMFNLNIKNKSIQTSRQNYLIKCKHENRIPNKPKTYKGETKEDMILRMQLHNPMKDKEVAQKVSNTLKQKYESGEIKKRIGKDNPVYKGNRPINKACRDALRNWVKEFLNEYNYTCLNCGKTKCTLHVHHKIPLRDIIERFKTKYNYDNDFLKNIEGTSQYYEFILKIVLYHYEHKNDIGIVVCKDCHSLIDKFYNKHSK